MLWLSLIQPVEGLKGKTVTPRRRDLCLWTAWNSSCSIRSLRVLQPVLQTCGLPASIVSQVSSTKSTCLYIYTQTQAHVPLALSLWGAHTS